ncbi:UbiA family prenyltransferase [Nocardioides zeae]|uniref:UbiA family prenyltransferase n=1 Tax=Nocardioides imazamoxiresistens TaxID=3231893 RepID=A0ABU3PY43_9ACTN|nr:UbiA family prenyltransferase [Nocardioides zeae]MDT9594161.1 UbiA family prenyltransferase [Nocardioides zeae]
MAAATTSDEDATTTASPTAPTAPVEDAPSPGGASRGATARARLAASFGRGDGSATPLPYLGTLVALVQASHPRQLVLTAGGVALAAFLAGRPLGEVALVLATVAVGQAVLGWHNDIVDAEDDARAGRPGKPLATGRLDVPTAWFAVAVGALALVPLAVANGYLAAVAYALSVAVGLVGNVVLRGGPLSWLPWAVAYALYPAYLSFGGLGGQHEGEAPTWALVALSAVLGVCVHVLRALPGLVQDNRDRRRHLPLRLAVRTGAPRLLVLTMVATAVVVGGLAAVGATLGLTA